MTTTYPHNKAGRSKIKQLIEQDNRERELMQALTGDKPKMDHRLYSGFGQVDSDRKKMSVSTFIFTIAIILGVIYIALPENTAQAQPGGQLASGVSETR